MKLVSDATTLHITHGIALATEVLPPYDIPQAEPDIKASIRQRRDAPGHQRVRALLAPACKVRTRVFVCHHAGSINGAKHATALKIGFDDAADFLRCLRVSPKWRNGNG